MANLVWRDESPALQAFPREFVEKVGKSKKRDDGEGGGERRNRNNSIGNTCYASYVTRETVT